MVNLASDEPEPLVLRNCGSMIHLELRSHTSNIFDGEVEWIVATLATLPSPSVLQRLTIFLSLSSVCVEKAHRSFSPISAIVSLRSVTIDLDIDVVPDLMDPEAAVIDSALATTAENLFRQIMEQIAPKAELSMRINIEQ